MADPDHINPQLPMMESRKFKALCLALIVYFTPVLLVFALVLTKNATHEDFTTMTKWMAMALSPIFAAYIGGVALEGWAEKRSTGPTAVSTTGSVTVTQPQGAPATTTVSPAAEPGSSTAPQSPTTG